MKLKLFSLLSIGTLLTPALVFTDLAWSQTILPFNATYQNTATSTLILSNFPFTISLTELQGISEDAPYGLTQLSGQTYSKVNLVTGELSFNTNPAVFGLSDLPQGLITFGALDGSQLIGSDSATGFIDFNTLIATASGTFTIIEGTGRFQGATGTINFSEVNQLSLDPSVPLTGIAQAIGSFEIPSVSEPTTVSSLLVLGLFFLKKLTKLQNKSN